MSTLLSGRSSLEAYVLNPAGSPGLDVLVAGQVPPTPSALPGDVAITTLLVKARDQYDVILIGTPPVLALSVAAVSANEADVMLLVAR